MITMNAERPALERNVMNSRARIERELHQLRECLADAWWNEKSLDEIQQIEKNIEACKRELHRAHESAN